MGQWGYGMRLGWSLRGGHRARAMEGTWTLVASLALLSIAPDRICFSPRHTPVISCLLYTTTRDSTPERST